MPSPSPRFWRDLAQTDTPEAVRSLVLGQTDWWTWRHPVSGAPVWSQVLDGPHGHHVIDDLLNQLVFRSAERQAEDFQGRTLWAYLLRGGTGSVSGHLTTVDRVAAFLGSDDGHSLGVRNTAGEGLLVQIYRGRQDNWGVDLWARANPSSKGSHPHRQFTWSDWIAGSPEDQQRAGVDLFLSTLSYMEGAAQSLASWMRPSLVMPCPADLLLRAPPLAAAVTVLASLAGAMPRDLSPVVKGAPRAWWSSRVWQKLPQQEAWERAMGHVEAQALHEVVQTPATPGRSRSRL